VAAASAVRRARDVVLPARDRDAVERLVSAARAELDTGTFEAAWSGGAAMTLEQVIAYAGDEKLAK
jgi:hypothetical protein